MQFPVPQFTDVEDKIIAGLTLKQFGILFGVGVIIFLGYSSTKSILVMIFLGVLFGVPALVVAFGKINGRPLYATFPILINYFTRPKFFIFKKQASTGGVVKVVKKMAVEPEKPKETSDSKRLRLAELQFKLDQSVSGKEGLLLNENSARNNVNKLK